MAIDGRQRILLTRLRPNYPGAGRWQPARGGTDYGEQPCAALIRELVERPASAAGSSSAGCGEPSRPGVAGAEGYPIDWHGVRAF